MTPLKQKAKKYFESGDEGEVDTAVPSDEEPAYEALGPCLVSDDEADSQASGDSDRLVEPHELVDNLQVADGYDLVEPPDRLVMPVFTELQNALARKAADHDAAKGKKGKKSKKGKKTRKTKGKGKGKGKGTGNRKAAAATSKSASNLPAQNHLRNPDESQKLDLISQVKQVSKHMKEKEKAQHKVDAKITRATAKAKQQVQLNVKGKMQKPVKADGGPSVVVDLMEVAKRKF